MSDSWTPETRASNRHAEPKDSAITPETLGAIAYAAMSRRIERSPITWNAIVVRGADDLWARLVRHHQSDPFDSIEDARAFAATRVKWSLKSARRELAPDDRQISTVDSELLANLAARGLPGARAAGDPESLAIEGEIADVVDQIIKQERKQVRDVALLIKCGLSFTEIDLARNASPGSSSKAWHRATERIARRITKRIGENNGW